MSYQWVLRRGSSAHALVHRSGLQDHQAILRFLRARAGSPMYLEAATEEGQVPPRTRGFTGLRLSCALRQRGSSAHARVHRCLSAERGCRRRFLRVRGFTAPLPRPRDGGHGSSARARVHRASRTSTANCSRFLRARPGSRWCAIGVPDEDPVPPRTRGFTKVRRPWTPDRLGSSAHARVHRRFTIAQDLSHELSMGS